MQRTIWIGLVATALCFGVGPRATARRAVEEQPTAVVGTYDSRAIAVAYVNSRAFRDYLRAQRADVERAIERAREAGDRALVGQLEELGPTMQQRMHEQGFGTAPVDDILARIADRIPGIARQAGVEIVVSKWAIAYRDPGAECVDVTDALVAAFDPDETTWERVRAIVATDPVPAHELKHDH